MDYSKILVNRDFKFQISDLKNIDLTNLDPKDTTNPNYKYRLNKETYIAFLKLKKFLLNEYNINIKVDGGYRSLYNQKRIYEGILLDNYKKYRNKYNKYQALLLAKDETNKTVAPVGASEHHTGLAIDLGIYFNNRILKKDKASDDKYRNEFYKIILKHINDFGFILRYPEDKESQIITGYSYEPWHIRFIGKEQALDMKQKNILTLEEYLRPDIYKRREKVCRKIK